LPGEFSSPILGL